MKKLIIASLIVGSVACVAVASNADYMSTHGNWSQHSEWNDKADWNEKTDRKAGHNRFVEQLNLDPERAAKMNEILSSYREIPKLYFTNQTDKIPEFLAQKETELEALLTPEELAQFKQAFADWAKKKNFKFMNFSAYQAQPQPNPALEIKLNDDLREEIQQSLNREILELRKQLHPHTVNA